MIKKIDAKYFDDEDIETLFPFYNDDWDRIQLFIEILAKFDKIKEKYLKILQNVNKHYQKTYVRAALSLHKNNSEFLKLIKPYLVDDSFKVYFEMVKDEEFLTEIEKNFKTKPLFTEKEELSFYHIYKSLDKKIDLKNYPHEKCKKCNLPLGMCKEDKYNGLKYKLEEKLVSIKEFFEKENYQECIKECFEVFEPQCFKYLIESYIKLNRYLEALLFIRQSELNQKEKANYLQSIPIENKQNSKEYLPCFELDFNNINTKDLVSEEKTDYFGCQSTDLLSIFFSPEKNEYYYKTYKENQEVFYLKNNIDYDYHQEFTENEIMFYDYNIPKISYYNLDKKTIRSSNIDCKYSSEYCQNINDTFLFDISNEEGCIVKMFVFDNQDFKLIKELRYHEKFEFDIKCSTDQNIIFLYSQKFRTLLEIDLKTGYHLKTYIEYHDYISNACADDHYLAIHSIDFSQRRENNEKKYLSVYDRKSGDLIKTKLMNISNLYMKEYLFVLTDEEELEVYIPHSLNLIHKLHCGSYESLICYSYLTEFRISFDSTSPECRMMRIPIINDKRIRKCQVCSLEMVEIKPKLCGRCFQVCYCSKECQVSHWPKHKFSCSLLK